jgi:hypothetical protein
MDAMSNSDRLSGAVFLIGLGVLFTPLAGIVGGFFPGILFVLGATAIAHGTANGNAHDEQMGGLFLIGLGLVFLVGFSLPVLLIGLGLLLLFGRSYKPELFGGRKAHDAEYYPEKQKHDELI